MHRDSSGRPFIPDIWDCRDQFPHLRGRRAFPFPIIPKHDETPEDKRLRLVHQTGLPGYIQMRAETNHWSEGHDIGQEFHGTLTDCVWELRTPLADLQTRSAEGCYRARVELALRMYVGHQIARDPATAVKLWKQVSKDPPRFDDEELWEGSAYAQALRFLSAHYVREYAETGDLAKICMSIILALKAGPKTAHTHARAEAVAVVMALCRDIHSDMASKMSLIHWTMIIYVYQEIFTHDLHCVLDLLRSASPQPTPQRVLECSRKGCTVRSEGPLRACSGLCPSRNKPLYCSEGRQKLDWPEHKPLCGGKIDRNETATLRMLDGTVTVYKFSELKSTEIESVRRLIKKNEAYMQCFMDVCRSYAEDVAAALEI
ncbi:hypothetical protein FA95DRAFT_1605090 [Auriscalpium vulgare]|uniref:Uncharacterized protein n=1 Tax=Auriscalpium vulgare TaxID=40419 RepID=A0ACB8RX38_9AGAM|nr:hypothetical protein FA95DRAFT_1605090 [Auriscalpium vulgare]